MNVDSPSDSRLPRLSRERSGAGWRPTGRRRRRPKSGGCPLRFAPGCCASGVVRVGIGASGRLLGQPVANRVVAVVDDPVDRAAESFDLQELDLGAGAGSIAIDTPAVELGVGVAVRASSSSAGSASPVGVGEGSSCCGGRSSGSS